MVKYLSATIFVLLCSGCGVKSDPLPPQTPTRIGRGYPTYQGATEQFAEPKKKKR